MSDKIFRVNMGTLSTSIEDIPANWAGLGGRGLTSTIVYEEVTPTCNPLGKDNKLIFAPGLLSGTSAANSGRLSAGSKSPLTGTIKESNSGGVAAQLFARIGVKALIIEGIPENDNWYSINISRTSITINEETELIGKNNFYVLDTLLARCGKDSGVITIGAAGEMKMATANISIMDNERKLRSLGRGGLGAVMGSKKIKFITIDTKEASKVTIADPEKFKTARKTFAKALVGNGISKAIEDYGTNVLVNIINEVGGFPTKNFKYGQFEDHEKISGETMHDMIVERGGKTKHNCHTGCVIQCSQVYNDKDGKYLTSGMEYESVWALGANAGVADLDIIAKADHLLDDLGIDTIELYVAFGVAMEAGILDFGDGAEVLRIINEEVAKGTPLGRLIGAGTGAVGRTYGMTRIPVVKNQAIPAYDPRSIKGIGITYATSTQGADHTMGYAIATNVLGSGGNIDPLKKEGQIELSRNLQIASAAIDSVGMCIFVAFAVLDDETCLPALIDMINARHGVNLTTDDVTNLGKNILKTERAFNFAAGLTKEDDRLPEFFKNEALPPHNAIWDFTDAEIDSFWNF